LWQHDGGVMMNNDRPLSSLCRDLLPDYDAHMAIPTLTYAMRGYPALVWVLGISGLFFAASILLLSLSNPFWIVLAGIPIAFIASILAFSVVIRFLLRREWFAALGVLLVSCSLYLATTFPTIPESTAAFCAQWVQLAWYRSRIDKEVSERMQAKSYPVIVTWSTGGVFSTEVGIGYDKSDEFKKAPGTQSASWQLAAKDTFVGGKCWEAHPLVGHYFKWVFDGACESNHARKH
jgi:hypothetical protein